MTAPAALERLVALEAFFDDMFQCAVVNAGDVDAFDMIESMEKRGLITSEPYDPEKHGEVEAAEPGDPIYVRVKA